MRTLLDSAPSAGLGAPLILPRPRILPCQNIRIGEQNVSGIKSNEYGDDWERTVHRSRRRLSEKPPPLEAKDAPMRWRMALEPLKMTELMITMKVAIILIKWDEM